MQFKVKFFIYLLLLAFLHTAGDQHGRAIKPLLLEENGNNCNPVKSIRLGKYHARRNLSQLSDAFTFLAGTYTDINT